MSDLSRDFFSLRRTIIEEEYENLNEMQKKAVFSVKGPLLILAGAGSGKTTVLISRIANLIRYGDGYENEELPAFIDETVIADMKEYIKTKDTDIFERIYPVLKANPPRPFQILAITFTNKAAGELSERLSDMLSPEIAKMVWSGTFHKICMRLLRFDGDKVGLNPSFTIYNTDDSLSVIKEALKALEIDDKVLPARAILKEISRAKDNLQTAAEFSESIGNDYRLKLVSKVYAMYEKRLREANALDFDDIIMRTVFLLRDNEDVKAKWQSRFEYVMVDEYQDTNRAQYVLISLLSGGKSNLCVVGDDDQSIYKFRGATIENILSFENQYKSAKVIRLEENYRSTQNILNAANGVIKNNKGRKGKSLWTKNKEGEKIKVVELINETEESSFIAEAINEKVSEKEYAYKDFAILYRVNAQSANIERTFAKSGIPYRIIGGLRFYDRKEIKDVISYFNVLENETDDLRLKRIINEPKRGIGDTTVDVIEALALSIGTSMMEILRTAKRYDTLSRAVIRITEFERMMAELADKKDCMPLDRFLDEVLEKTGYLKALEAQNNEESKTRIENLMELKSNILAYMRSTESPSLRGFLEEVSLLTDVDRYDENSDAVVLMTIHSAKGLEFPVVFLTGADEGIFPGMMVSTSEELEEERRLCYVAITRAKNELFVTTATDRLLYGRTMHYQPSRFLNELPKEYVENIRKRPRKTYDFTEKQDRSKEVKGDKSSLLSEKKTAGEFFAPGDQVAHKVFGEGTVLSSKMMGNDCLLEVAFLSAGTKKLMQNFANLKKI